MKVRNPCLIAIVVLVIGLPVHGENSKDRVRQLGLIELAATFSEQKIARCLPDNDKTADLLERQATALLACLGVSGTNMGLLATPMFAQLTESAMPAWLTSGQVQIAAFESRLQKAMAAGLSTGYNVVPQSNWPDFDPTRTVIYGHSDWRHARQLVALLHSEGLRPNVTALVKKSAFLHRENWGEPEQPLPTLATGQRYVDQLEYDLFIDFAEPADVQHFTELVDRYAKKDSEDEAGLIHGAWWQPFYRTLKPFAGAHQLTVMLVTSGGYRANLMSIPDLAAEKIRALKALDPEWQVTTFDIWVNPGFYRNQLGDYR